MGKTIKKQSAKKELNTDLENDHIKISTSFKNSFAVPVEWCESGDHIEKFSLYDNYTPVKTSSNTTLINP